MTVRDRTRLLAVLISMLLVPLVTTSARAETAVHLAKRDRREAVADARAFRSHVAERETSLRARMAHARSLLEERPGAGLIASPGRGGSVRREAVRRMQGSVASLASLDGWRDRHLDHLRDIRDDATAWLATYGIFEVCPVPSYTNIADNFGYVVRPPGVPVHVHQGNDISAPTGAPILAPFDGSASSTVNDLGGLSVYVHGPRGYVYNAHLSRLGSLGSVEAGDVIGYVGTTGDATGPHDHFEWHPWNGHAVDPSGLLGAACVDV